MFSVCVTHGCILDLFNDALFYQISNVPFIEISEVQGSKERNVALIKCVSDVTLLTYLI